MFLKAGQELDTRDPGQLWVTDSRSWPRPGQDALFEDPFAKALSGSDGLTMSDRLGEAASQFGFDGWPEFHKARAEHNPPSPSPGPRQALQWMFSPLEVWTVVRTKFIDDLISRDTAEIPQMVNLGAGVDTRPYRLDAYKQFKASYEVDTAEVMLRLQYVYRALYELYQGISPCLDL